MMPDLSFRHEFDSFRERVLDADRLAHVAVEAGIDPVDLGSKVNTSLGETEFTLHMLDGHLEKRMRLLEVGAGLGLTSAFLASLGFDITSIEPGGSGFEDYERINPVLRSSLGIDHAHHRASVDTVTVDVLGGRFDLIFSNNVLEHVDDVDAALGALDDLLTTEGFMAHHCPNYTIPYEPHFGIPLLPFRPERTTALLPDRITSTGLWRSLNFVTARDIERIANRRGAELRLERGLLADTVQRLTEPEFARRHPQLRRLAPLLARVDPMLRRIPPTAATPMVFTWHRRAVARNDGPNDTTTTTTRR